MALIEGKATKYIWIDHLFANYQKMKSIKFSDTEITKLNEIKNILGKYNIKYFKITKTKICFKIDGVKYYTDFANINEKDKSEEELELDFTDENDSDDEEGGKNEKESSIIRKRKKSH